MGKKLTTEEFLSKVKLYQKSEYDFSKAVYKGSTTPLEVICQKHSSFWITPDSLYAGCGCLECSKESARQKAEDSFISQSEAKFGDLIDHAKTEYNGPENKAVLFCKIHGRFEVNPSTHLCSKHGCTICGALASPKIRAEKKKLTFLDDAFNIHGTTYTYEKFEYKTTKDKGEITCKKHGSFWQSPQKHLSGQGCPDCAMYGYNTSRPGNFYILTNGEITKVGITHQKVKERIYQIHKSYKFDSKFKVVATMFYQDGAIPRKLENACLTYLRNKYQQVSEVFDGSTECFYNVDLNELLAFVTPLSQATQSELEQSSQPLSAQ